MARKSAKVDDLLEQLKDERVIERLIVCLTPVIEDIFNRFVDAFSTKLESLVERSSYDLITKHCESQVQRLNTLEEENESLKVRLDQAEVELRQNNLIIHGLEESVVQTGLENSGSGLSTLRANHEATSAVVSLCNSRLGLSVTEADISSAFRMPRRGKDKHRPIIVKFISLRVRNMVYMSRLTLKKSPLGSADSAIYINEHLTKLNAQIYAGARRLVSQKKATSAWTSGGKIYVRLTEAQGGKAIRMSSLKNVDECAVLESTTLVKSH